MSDVPPDTDQYIYRPVTRVILNDAGDGAAPVVETVMTQIWITQP